MIQRRSKTQHSTNGYWYIGNQCYRKDTSSLAIQPMDYAHFSIHRMMIQCMDQRKIIIISSIRHWEFCFWRDYIAMGDFWTALKFSLKMNCKIIDVCMRLHNFIVDNCNNDNFGTSMDRIVFDDDCQ